MTAPASFQLDPVQENNNLPPTPPKQLKEQIYKDLSFFNDVDEHAISVCEYQLSTVLFYNSTSLFWHQWWTSVCC
jgi:hypothetical protein